MAILSLPIILPAEVDIRPIVKRMVVSDSLAVFTAPGFLNSSNLQSSNVSAGDVIDVAYNADIKTKVGPVVRVEASVVGNQIVLTPEINGYRIISKVTGDFAFGPATFVINDAEIKATSIVMVMIIAHGGAETIETILNIAVADGTITIQMTNTTTGTLRFAYTTSILK